MAIWVNRAAATVTVTSAMPHIADIVLHRVIRRNVPLASFPIICQQGARKHRRTATPADWFGMVEIEARGD
jgi:hypothetical protein